MDNGAGEFSRHSRWLQIQGPADTLTFFHSGLTAYTLLLLHASGPFAARGFASA